ncbi:UDP-glucose dehydrogenase family protein [Candidatus Spongiihabitans sp.]|uniref:UDP-glucose dehydrogenase family protein n=1 Tax=Candidatus Spongiihabitans sp. TaxID=3101308 RepID=UPI003C703B04
MNITVVGSGYVGLVSGACLSEMGNNVVCIDTDQGKIDGLRKGIIPIYEPGLETLIRKNMASERLSFTTSIEKGVNHGEVIFIAVGTPSDEDGSADLQYVKRVAQSIGEQINDYRVVVTKSTVPVGTSGIVKATINQALENRDLSISFSVVSNPEFLKVGAAVKDFMKPDRIVVGVEDDRALDILRNLYAPFNRNHERLIVMDVPSAELTKYTANAMLATKISFMNEISNLADCLGADIESVRIGIGADPRIGYSFIYPGCGYGGSCFSKDVQALHRTAKEASYDARILSAIEAVNNDQKRVPVNKIVDHFGTDLKGKKFALWGLSFKPDTDDMRGAPSRVVMEALWEMGATVQAFDPVATDEALRIYGERDDLTLFSDTPYDALTDVDCLIVVTEWRVFRSSDIDQIKSKMRGNVIVDGRNIFSPRTVTEAGLSYYGIGRQ